MNITKQAWDAFTDEQRWTYVQRIESQRDDAHALVVKQVAQRGVCAAEALELARRANGLEPVQRALEAV